MNTLQRPLFRAKGGGAFPDLSGDGKVTQKDILIGRGVIERQEGGPAGPMMPPQAMAQGPDPRMVQEVEQVQRRNEMVGEEAGAAFVAESLRGIDEAEDFEEFINSIRGNAKPITARRDELATYVGRADADQTPESVLALVQPTFMLTEEGAIDSGIGELLQNITGGVEMMGESGMPTEMGEGIGGLMMAGQPGPEPVRMRFGGDPADFFEALQEQYPVSDLGDLVQSNKALFEQFMTDPNQMSEDDFQKGLALARAGFQLASGVGPGGENIADRPLLSQAASVAGGYIETEAERMAQRRARERQIEMMALQSAMTQRQGQQDFQRELAADIAGKRFDLMGKLAVEAAKQKPFQELRVLQREDGSSYLGLVTQNEEGGFDSEFFEDLDDRAKRDVDFGKMKPADIARVWSEWGPSFDQLEKKQQQDIIEGLQFFYTPSRNEAGGVEKPQGVVPPGMARALRNADTDLMSPAFKALLTESLGEEGVTPTERPTETVEGQDATGFFAPPKSIIPSDFSMREVYGLTSRSIEKVRNFADFFDEIGDEVFGMDEFFETNRVPLTVASKLRGLINKGKELRRAGIQGRLFATTLDEINGLFDQIDPLNPNTNDAGAKAGFEALALGYRRALVKADDTIRRYNQFDQGITKEDFRDAMMMKRELPAFIEEFDRAANSFGAVSQPKGGVIFKGDSKVYTRDDLDAGSAKLDSLGGQRLGSGG